MKKSLPGARGACSQPSEWKVSSVMPECSASIHERVSKVNVWGLKPQVPVSGRSSHGLETLKAALSSAAVCALKSLSSAEAGL